MKKIILSLLLTMPVTAFATPSSLVAWTPEKLNQVAAGDIVQGKKLAVSCAACHGEDGVGTAPEYPSLAGQLPTYLYKQLRDYADGKRQNPIMNAMSHDLSDQDMIHLAAWYGSLDSPRSQKTTMFKLELAEKLVDQGDENRMRTPCTVCHGGSGEGAKMDIPALTAQNSLYLETTLKAFRNGSRKNDIYSRMRQVAKNLTDEEIKELAQYYRALD